MQEGVVDELSLMLAPAADGDPHSVTIFEQSPFLREESHPIEFPLKDIERLNEDGLRLIYTVK